MLTYPGLERNPRKMGVIEAGIEGALFVLRLSPTRHRDDEHRFLRGPLPQPTTRFVTVDFGHAAVEEDDVGWVFLTACKPPDVIMCDIGLS
jgi:hypothetical protein